MNSVASDGVGGASSITVRLDADTLLPFKIEPPG